MPRCFNPCRIRHLLLAAAVFAARPILGGGVHLDGSFGQSGALPGPNYMIPAEAGKQVGGNLFHSFSQFDLSNGESATFLAPLNPNAGAITNILARITSGSVSNIDGTIHSAISGANLFLINPSGFVFGPHTSLDISGSFTVTSANSVKLADGGHFDAHPGTGDLTLSAAPVSAFGFLPSAGGITLGNTSDFPLFTSFSVPAGKNISLIGGDVSLTFASLSAPAGQVSLVSTSGASSIAANLQVSRPNGTINLQNSAISTSGPTGGRVVIRGGSLTVNDSQVISTTQSAGSGAGIDIRLSGSMAVGNNGQVLTQTSGSGAAGKVSIRSGSLSVSGNGFVGSLALPSSTASASTGTVSVNTGSLSVSTEGIIAAYTSGLGRGGDVSISAQNISLSGDTSGVVTGIFSDTGTPATSGAVAGGRGGDVRIHAADQISVTFGAEIATDTYNLARGGDVTISATDIYLAAYGNASKSGIFADTNSFGAGGRGGDVNIQADNVTIANGGLISTKTLGLGAAGDTQLSVDDLIIDQNSSRFITGIAANSPLGGGKSGNVSVFAHDVSIFDGGRISASTGTAGSANPSANGHGGSVFLQADNLLLVGNGDLFTGISAGSLSSGAGGHGGNVDIVADSLEVFDGARISANASGMGAGGDVTVTANQAYIAGSDPAIFTGISATTLSPTLAGSGGSIRAAFGELTLVGSGGITCDTLGPGIGGNVIVTAGTAALLAGGRISAGSNGSGNGGDIMLTADDLFVSGSNSLASSGIVSNSQALGIGGTGGLVRIDSRTVHLLDGGTIGATSSNSGAGGSIVLNTGSLELESGSSIAASTTGAGAAGSVTINVARSAQITGGSSVSTTSAKSDAGTVSISTPSLDLDGSNITVEAALGNAGQISLSVDHLLNLFDSQLLAAAGNTGGNITVDPMFLLLNDSLISANAVAGRGGNILLTADFYFNSETPITATGSQAGTVNIAAPELDLSNGLVTLPGSVIDASTRIREQCAQRLGLDFSSFLVLGRGSVDTTPDEAQSSLGTASPPAAPPAKRTKR